MRPGCLFMSARHSGQTAISGLISEVSSELSWLARITKSSRPSYLAFSTFISSTWETTGARFFKSSTKPRISDGGPSTLIDKPSVRLTTQPFRLYFRARRYTKGLNPTPCTNPVTAISLAIWGFGDLMIYLVKIVCNSVRDGLSVENSLAVILPDHIPRWRVQGVDYGNLPLPPPKGDISVRCSVFGVVLRKIISNKEHRISNFEDVHLTAYSLQPTA